MALIVKKNIPLLSDKYIFYKIGQNLLTKEDTEYSNDPGGTANYTPPTTLNITHGDEVRTWIKPRPNGFGTYKAPVDNYKRITFDADTGKKTRVCQLLLKGDFGNFKESLPTDKKSYLRTYQVIYYDYEPGKEYNSRRADFVETHYLHSYNVYDHEAFVEHDDTYKKTGIKITVDQLHYALNSKKASKALVSYLKGESEYKNLLSPPAVKNLDSIKVSKLRSKEIYKLTEPYKVGSIAVDTLLTGTRDRDKIIGKSTGEIIASGEGKDTLIGADGADGFLFNHKGRYGQKHADIIVDFNSYEGDSILLDQDIFELGKKVKIRSFNGEENLSRAQKWKKRFVYDKAQGHLYFNENGRKEGWGDGGLLAILEGVPQLGSDDFTVV